MSEKEGINISGGAVAVIISVITIISASAGFLIGRVTGKKTETDEIKNGDGPDQSETKKPESFQQANEHDTPQKKRHKLLMGIMVSFGSICAFISSWKLRAKRRLAALQCIEAANKVEKDTNFIWICPASDISEIEEIKEMNPAAVENIEFIAAETWIAMLEVLRKTVKSENTKNSWYEAILKVIEKVPLLLFQEAVELPAILKDNKSVVAQLLKTSPSKVLAARESAMKKSKITDEEKVGPLWLCELIGSVSDCSLVIDTFSSLVNNTTKISNTVIMKLMVPFFGTGRNLFLLHCENKQHLLSGGDGLGELIPSVVAIEKTGKDTYSFEETNGTSLHDINCVSDLIGSKAEGFKFSERDKDGSTKAETKHETAIQKIKAVLEHARKITRGQLYEKVPAAHGTIDNKLRELVGDPESKVRIIKANTTRKDSIDDVIELVA